MTKNKSLKLAAAGFAVATAITATSTVAAMASAGAPSSAKSSGATARYDDKTIRLSESWGTAKSCVVYSGGAVECFDSNRAADLNLIHRGLATVSSFGPDAKTRITGEAAFSHIPDCADRWLCLWEHTYGGGRRLIFQDETWQFLADFGFKHKVSSYRNRQWDGAGALRDHTEFVIDYTLDADAYVGNVGWFNDRAEDVHP